MAKAAKTHTLLVRVTFNRPCTRSDAVAAVRESIWGDFYPYMRGDNAPDHFKVAGARSAKVHKPRAPLRAVSKYERFAHTDED